MADAWPADKTTVPRAPNSVDTNAGTYGGVEAPCWCDVVGCNHTLEPIRSQGPMPAPATGLQHSSFNAGQSYGGDKVR